MFLKCKDFKKISFHFFSQNLKNPQVWGSREESPPSARSRIWVSDRRKGGVKEVKISQGPSLPDRFLKPGGEEGEPINRCQGLYKVLL